MTQNELPQLLSVCVDDSVVRASLDGDLTVSTVEALKDELFGLLNHASIQLDIAGLQEVDTCGLQLLLVFQRQALLQQRDFSVDGKPPQFADLLNLYGLSGFPMASAQEGCS